VGRFPGVAAARQRRANFRCAFSAFQFVEIRAIRVEKFSRSSCGLRFPSSLRYDATGKLYVFLAFSCGQ